MNWSGGKDSALALYKAQQKGISIDALVTSVNISTDKVSMHGVRRNLLMEQTSSIGLPLDTIELPEMPGMEPYENAVRQKHRQMKTEGFTHAIFGDIFLEDLRKYREELLAKDNLQCIFPIWRMDSREVLVEFIQAGFKAIVVCVNSQSLDKRFCGRLIDESFMADLPLDIDPCGENGEYHSFVFDGPVFSKPISFTTGEINFKEYAQPSKGDDSVTAPQRRTGFHFQDLIVK